jgi:hypothetical protein
MSLCHESGLNPFRGRTIAGRTRILNLGYDPSSYEAIQRGQQKSRSRACKSSRYTPPKGHDNKISGQAEKYEHRCRQGRTTDGDEPDWDSRRAMPLERAYFFFQSTAARRPLRIRDRYFLAPRKFKQKLQGR